MNEFPSRSVNPGDRQAIEALHDVAFGPGALTRAAYRVREGQPDHTPYCRVLYDGLTLVASIRYTAVSVGGKSSALLLGPLMVAPEYANQGHGRRLIAESLEAARAGGIELVLLVGDPPYYQRFGFVPATPGQFQLPGPVDPRRLLMLDLGSLAADADPRGTFRGRVAGVG